MITSSNKDYDDLVENLTRFAYSPSRRADAIMAFLPRLKDEDRGQFISEAFNALKRWNDWGSIDTPSYAHAVNTLIPYLYEEQVLFLWERAIKELESDDSEHRYFGEITIAGIAPFLPYSKKGSLLESIDTSSVKNEKVMAVLLLEKSSCLCGDERIALQIESWQYAANHYNSPRYSQSCMYANTLEWKDSDSKTDSTKFVGWLEYFLSNLEQDAILSVWQAHISKVPLIKYGEDKIRFFGQLRSLASNIPADYIVQALGEIIEIFVTIGRQIETTDLIKLLISRLPEGTQKVTWQKVFDDLLAYNPPFLLADPYKLAGLLTYAMPMELQYEMFIKFYTKIRRVDLYG